MAHRSAVGGAAWLAAFLALAGAGGAAAGQGDAAVGRGLARSWCSGCHVVGVDDPANAGQASSNGAPSFVAVARNPALTRDSIAAFLRAPHAPMPDLHLGAGEIRDLAAYIASLR